MMKVVTKEFEDLLQDEGIIVTGNPKGLELLFRCPKCNEIYASKTGNHIYNPDTNSIKPSVICPCGFHKTLTNGIWK